MPNSGYIVAGKYRLDREIGKGGFGVVYRAEAVEGGRVVAVKLVSRNDEGQVAGYRMASPRARRWSKVGCASESSCPHCGDRKTAVFAKGNRASLPCRAAS